MKRPPFKYVQVTTTRHGRTAIYFCRGPSNPKIRLPDNMEAPEFKSAYLAAFSGNAIPHVRTMPATKIKSRIGRTKNYLESGLRAAKTRSRKKGIPCDLTLDFLFALAEEQGYRCVLTGIEFFAPCTHPGRTAPYIPSIDRINPKLGYVQGNVRLTVYAVNAMLLDWGEDVFRQVSNSFRYWQGQKRRLYVPTFAEDVPTQNSVAKINGLDVETDSLVRSRIVRLSVFRQRLIGNSCPLGPIDWP